MRVKFKHEKTALPLERFPFNWLLRITNQKSTNQTLF